MNTSTQSISLTVPTTCEPATWNMELSNHLAKTYRNTHTRETAAQHIRVFSLWYAATFNQDFAPQLLTNYDLHLYRAWSLEKEKVMARTWNSRHWALNILCKWLGSPELMDGIEQKACARASTKHRSLTDDEYHRLVHALEQNIKRTVTQFEYINAVRDWASVMLMLHGLRVEEVTLVDVDDITLNERSGDVLVRNGKGSKERTVPLNLIARNALRLWLDLGAASPKLGAPSNLGEVGEARRGLFAITTRTLQRNVAILGEQIHVPELTPHWLRYTFAKRLERIGTPIEAICELLGHSNIEQTKRYLRSSLEELQSAVEEVM